ncbi:MAG: class I SAM-dependent methyltransferase [Candidatus Thermoplasmatota archaeon]|jgi:ubiquinone/menaquinone biosynthesis C-methylase UbiE|nr:class I SAM-dependent methyltransferase [Candidatus Thermoplasmatota archaeon]MCK5300864.1 class I SAM-dependent methyltransferase [Thermoplasmatales archaeon]
MNNDTFKKAKMFNNKASRKKSKANKVIDIIKIMKGNKIADIGSGGGYFTIRFAKLVGDEGHIYAIDTNSEFLKYIKLQADKNDLKNITTIQADDDKPKLPKEKLDYIFLRNVYHHIPNRLKYLQILGEGLGKDGKIIIIEHNGSGYLNFNKLFGHYIKPEIIKNEMKKVGYIIDEEHYFITQQSFTIFKIR